MDYSKTTCRNPRRSSRKDKSPPPRKIPSRKHSKMTHAFGEAQAELLVKQQAWLHEHHVAHNKDAFFYLSWAMAKVFPVIMKDPDVQKRPTVEGERVGKLLRKYTTLLEQYKPEAEARLIKLIEALMSNKGVKLFWKCVLENYRPVDETSKKTTEKSSKTTVEETVMETIETSSDDI